MAIQFLDRLKGRIKYGLLTQEILDRFAKMGFRLMPYLIVDESAGASLDFNLKPAECELRPLSADDMFMIASMEHRKKQLGELIVRLNEADCLGVFVDDTLAGYTWSRYDRIARSNGRIELHRLRSNEAYLFDMYVDKRFRGLQLAPLLRHCMYQQLVAKDRRRFYSISEYFNRSSRKFKAKLGARELELRLGLTLWRLVDADFLIRRYVADNALGTKHSYFARGKIDAAWF